MARRAKTHYEDADIADRFATVAHAKVDRVAEQLADAERQARALTRYGAERAQRAGVQLHDEAAWAAEKVSVLARERPLLGAVLVVAAGLFALSALRR
jgi:hypothetical protein